jgi:hypothetical protein
LFSPAVSVHSDIVGNLVQPSPHRSPWHAATTRNRHRSNAKEPSPTKSTAFAIGNVALGKPGYTPHVGGSNSSAYNWKFVEQLLAETKGNFGVFKSTQNILL